MISWAAIGFFTGTSMSPGSMEFLCAMECSCASFGTVSSHGAKPATYLSEPIGDLKTLECGPAAPPKPENQRPQVPAGVHHYRQRV